ncbi:hypothetical protein GCM10023310_19740 [Paenibacillus vulneris]
MGIIITNNGYSEAAKNRAEAKGIRLEILTFEEFEDYNLSRAIYEEIYLEEAGLEPLPDEDSIIEDINEHEDIQELLDLPRKYSTVLDSYADEIIDIYDDLKNRLLSNKDLDAKRESLEEILHVFFNT